MNRYELKIDIREKKYTDQLIVALVRQGLDVYLSSDSFDKGEKESICFQIEDSDLTKINE
jgi:hypothetical protein